MTETIILKIVLELLGAFPTIFTDIKSVVDEIRSNDPQSTKVSNIVSSVQNLATAVTTATATPNGAND